VRFLSLRTGSITVVGDEDQSIYRWRGADIRNILDFTRDHPGATVIKLEQNYRSTNNILRVANAIIARNTERRPKRLVTEQGAGAPVTVFEGENEREEAEYVAGDIAAQTALGHAPRDFAIFYRTNAQSRVLEEVLRARNIPYIVVGGTRFYDRAEIKDLLAYLRFLQNPADSLALMRIINVPARGIGSTTVERLIAVADQHGLSLSAALEVATADIAILGRAAQRKVADFSALLAELRNALGLSPAALAEKVLERSGYRDALTADGSLESEGRKENLLELVAQIREYERESEREGEAPSLAGFLERVTLVADVDEYDADKGAVALMTVHTAKGLEFDAVFVTGMEEGIFPHQRSIDDDGAMEEERRLCYVAVTRARKRLMLCRARARRLSGKTFEGVPSRFLRDLPPDGIEHLVTARPDYLEVGGRGAGPWQGGWNRAALPDGSARPPSSPRSRVPAGSALGRYGSPGESPPPQLPGPPPATARGEITVHYDQDVSAGEDELGLHAGVKVRHQQFGTGEVRACHPSGSDLKVTVAFAKVGTKTVLARFLARR
jgi:DNA helicase-2/ATP-dependent DNA helicase PcrA